MTEKQLYTFRDVSLGLAIGFILTVGFFNLSAKDTIQSKPKITLNEYWNGVN